MFKNYCLTFVSLFFGAHAFAGMPIDDLYYGSNRNTDVWGDATVFDTKSMTVDVTSTQVKFTVESNFIGYLNHSQNYGARLGDLFFQFDSWTPFSNQNDSPWVNDDMDTGTKWDFALHLEDLPTTGSGSTPGNGGVSLYQIDSTKYDTEIISSDEFWNDPNNDGDNTDKLSGSVRENQEVLVDTEEAKEVTSGVTGGAWVVDTNAKTLEMTLNGNMFDLFGFNSVDGGVVSFHWAMTCANDTIEGEAQIPGSSTGQVPEPSTAAIFGIGMLGLAVARRRRKASQA